MENDEPTYLHNDLLGSPVVGTDKFGNVIWQEHYTPYGEKIRNSAANDDLGSFTGHIDDSSTGLTYMQARYYDPVIGRFLSNDPVDFLGHLNRGNSAAHGFNRYAYANNNPYKYTDPDGRFCVPCAAAGVGAVINTAAYFATTDTSSLSLGQIAAGAGKAALVGAAVGAATSVGAGHIAAAGLSSTTTAVAVAGAAGAIGAAGEAGSQIASSGSVTNPTSVAAAGVGNAIGAITGGAASGPITKAITAATSTSAQQGTGVAIRSLSGKVFPPIGSTPEIGGSAPVGAVTTLSEAAGGVAGAATATTISDKLNQD